LQRGWGMSERRPEGISAEDWAATPVAVRGFRWVLLT